MPLREYRCTSCGKTIERLEFGSDPPPTGCKVCGGQLERIISAPGSVRVGAMRPPGKTCCGRDERCDTPPCDSGGPCCSE